MKEEDATQSPATEFSGDIAGKLTVLLSETDDESELSQDVHIKEELIEEIMQDLYKEISSSSSSSSCSTLPPSFSSPSSSSSSSSLLSLQFDVKSESCGASVSDTASTVMAGVEFVGPAGNFAGVNVGPPENGSWVRVGEGEVERGCDDGESKMNGCDGVEVGDEWLARVLSWGPLELEEWT